MKTKKLYHSAVLFTVIVIVNSSCVTKQITTQVAMQKILLSPQQSNKAWVLGRLNDEEEIKYYLSYYTFNYEFRKANVGIGEALYRYDDAVRKVDTLDGDYSDAYKIDNNLTDCLDGLDIEEGSHLFFRAANYPDFKSKKKVEYNNTITRKLAYETASTATNPNIPGESRYYYEELIFEPNGRFNKKVFLADNSCNFISFTGKWIFRTPAAITNTRTGFSETEIELDYDIANPMGIPPKGNVYVLKQFGDDEIIISKKYMESDSSLLAVRGNYTEVTDKIVYAPNVDFKQVSFANSAKGKVVYLGKKVCAYPVEQPDDRIEIYDPLTLVKSKEYYSEAIYSKGALRCKDSTNTDSVINRTGEQNTIGNKIGRSSGIWEAYLGLGLSTKTGKEPEYNFTNGGQIGVEKQVTKLSEYVGLSAGAVYSMQGGKYESSAYVPGEDYSTTSRTSRLSYINFPVMARYQKQSTGFFAEVGVQPGVLISAKDKGATTNDIKDDIKKFDVGIPVGVGYKFKNKFGVGLRFTPGLLNVNKDDQYKNRNMVASLRTSYSF
jgi:hypothetical protein